MRAPAVTRSRLGFTAERPGWLTPLTSSAGNAMCSQATAPARWAELTCETCDCRHRPFRQSRRANAKLVRPSVYLALVIAGRMYSPLRISARGWYMRISGRNLPSGVGSQFDCLPVSGASLWM